MEKEKTKMKRILLIEPNYKNKYPPVGLMKISTYFKEKGYFVQFNKGLMPLDIIESFDRVFITTLFTFDFDLCIDTIKYYISIVGIENVYVGGIAATIMPEKFQSSIPGLQMLIGRLTSSSVLGYDDNINIDALDLDYDMLLDIPYEYPMADSYFIHTTRGCPRKCGFCAVKTLEPNFFDCDNIIQQVRDVDAKYGIKRNLLIMDNNILYSKRLDQIVEEICSLGFANGNNTVKRNNPMRFYIASLFNRIKEHRTYVVLLLKIKQVFQELNFNRIRNGDISMLNEIIATIKSGDDNSFLGLLEEKKDSLIEFFDRYYYHKITRYVDFNQGLDSRLFTEDKAQLLGRLALKPCRIAFDSLNTKEDYFRAVNLCVKNNINYFSNYLLYNYEDSPEDLWERLYMNIDFCKNNPDISLFSFPMKYASIKHTDRNFVGENWNKKYLRAINIILNVTKGVVAKEEDFFIRAYGKSPDEFLEILSMPDDFIRFRDFFDQTGLSESWRNKFRNLSLSEKELLLETLSSCADADELRITLTSNEKINAILPFYSVTKNGYEKDTLYYKKRLCNSTTI